VYRHCIYCAADLGSNQVLEAFPVGRTIAFDATRGRLWAVCQRCARWNLALLEERWERVEQAEQAFREATLRVQSESVGLAHLADGTRLVRVGDALPGELAAWRYGTQLRRRRAWSLARAAVRLILLDVGAALAWSEANQRRERVLIVAAPTDGEEVRVLGRHLIGARLTDHPDHGLTLESTGSQRWSKKGGRWAETEGAPVVMRGMDAAGVLAIAMVDVNRYGASARTLDAALRSLAASSTVAGMLERERRRSGASLVFRSRLHGLGSVWVDASGRRTAPASGELLALEMALHEEEERRALEGELTVLEAAWREAEEIAAIADRLAVQSGGGGGRG
jgi:hypothetical protein